MTNLGVGGEGGFWDGVDPAALAVPSVVDGEHVEAAPLEDLVELAAVVLTDCLGVAVQVQDHGGAGRQRIVGLLWNCNTNFYTGDRFVRVTCSKTSACTNQ